MALDPKKSLCWGCKYGTCILEEVRQEADMPETPEFLSSEFPDQDATGHPSIVMRQISGICYWSPLGLKPYPAQVSNVKECNNFSPKDD